MEMTTRLNEAAVALLQRAHHRLLTGGWCSSALIACVASRSFLTENGVSPTAWRHAHPTRLDRLRHWAARRLRTTR
ncbi:hypothetical protein ACGFYE_39565 [Streptomyces zaomyceticus]|uniref:hypothetical protein n=1 Tax=Streptomyces zaomyceticus TaxID=68286 RepID=UPI0037102864